MRTLAWVLSPGGKHTNQTIDFDQEIKHSEKVTIEDMNVED